MKVLIVDDEKLCCEVIKDVLEMEGYEVFKAYDGKEAMRRLYTVSPDLMILDISMPEMNGYEVCERIRSDKFYKNLPILMLSGNCEDSRAKSLNSGANEHITKPFKFKDFMTALRVMSNLARDSKADYKELAVNNSSNARKED